MGDAAVVTTVSRSHGHGVGKTNQKRMTLLAGFGVEGDVDAGATVKHRSRVAQDAEQPNLRQVEGIQPGLIRVELPDPPHRVLQPV